MDIITEKQLNKIMTPIAKKYNMVHTLEKRDKWIFNPNVMSWLDKPVMWNYRLGDEYGVYVTYDKLYIYDKTILLNKVKNLAEVKELIESYIKIIMLDLRMTIETSDYIINHEDSIIGKGELICYKKVYNKRYYIAKLQVPKSAERFQACGERKFRVSEARVLGFYMVDKNGKLKKSKIKHAYPIQCITSDFVYYLDKVVYPDSWDSSPKICSNGIHCFMKYESAWNY